MKEDVAYSPGQVTDDRIDIKLNFTWAYTSAMEQFKEYRNWLEENNIEHYFSERALGGLPRILTMQGEDAMAFKLRFEL